MTARRVSCSYLMLFLCCGLPPAGAQSTPWSAVEVRGQGDAPLDRILFVNDHVGRIIAGAKTISKTIDGGKTWTVLRTNLDEPGTEVTGIWFANDDRGWAAGTVGQHPAIWQSHDGGTTWTTQQKWPRAYADSNGAMLDVRFADDTYGWGVGYNGANALIVATHDGGRHWNTLYAGSEIAGQFSRVWSFDRLNVWVLSRDGALMQTKDGGESWQLRYFDPGLLNAIDVAGPSAVWVAGAWGHLLHTRNAVA
jgi:photosystem II stability/assembly factor-like uncharacterized protein